LRLEVSRSPLAATGHGARFARKPAVRGRGGALRAHGPLLGARGRASRARPPARGARFARRACAYRVSTSKSFLQVEHGPASRREGTRSPRPRQHNGHAQHTSHNQSTSHKQDTPKLTTKIASHRYATRFLTHKDAATHFKHITHRVIFTRNRKPELNKKDRLCRLCHKAKEDSLHMGQCQVLQTLLSRINRFNATTIRICFALRRGDQTNNAVLGILFLAPRADVTQAIGSLLTILWKDTLMHWYKVDIEKKKLSRTPYGYGARPSEDSQSYA
jgi:hypothetical protein